MRQLDRYEEEPKRCYRRIASKDRESWRNGASKGGRSRWALHNLPPIDPDDPWSSDLTLTEE